MKHEHKLIALLLCLAMLLGLLAGCGSSQSAASEADAEASDAGDAVASAEEPPEDTPEAVQDEGSASELAEAAVEGSEVEEAAEIQEDDELFTWGKISFHPTEIPLPLTDEDVTLSLWTDFLPPLFAAMNGMEDNSVYIELDRRGSGHHQCRHHRCQHPGFAAGSVRGFPEFVVRLRQLLRRHH